MKKMISILILIFNLSFAHDIYKEIRINNFNYTIPQYIRTLGVHVDHSIINNEYMQFVINENDIAKLQGRIDFEIIHDNVEEFYQSRPIQNY